MELTALQQLVHQMYIAYYQRPADPDGLQYWVDQLEQNGDWTAVSAAFGAPENEENQALYGDLNREQTIAAIYQSAFNREAVAEEVAFWAASEFSATDLTFAIVNGAQNSDKATVDNKVAFSAELVAQVGTNAAYAELQDPKALLTAVTEETEVTADYVSDAVASGKVGETFSLTAATDDTLIGTAGSDTFTGDADTYSNTDQIIDQSSADNDVFSLTVGDFATTITPDVTGVENINITANSLNAETVDVASIKGAKNLTISRGDVVVGGSTLTGDKTVDVNNVDASQVAAITVGAGTTTVDIDAAADDKAGLVVNADEATTSVNVDGASTINAANATGTVAVNAVTNTAAAETGKATVINAAKAATVSTDADLTGSITINAAAATSVTVGDAQGGATVDAQAAKATINVSGIDDTGATVTAGTGTKDDHIKINLDGTTKTTDVATVSAAGLVDLDNEVNAGNDVETLTLSGNGAAATYYVADGGVLTSVTKAGDQSVTLSGNAATFTAVSMSGVDVVAIDSDGAGALDASKFEGVGKITVANDMGADITVSDAQTVEFSANQTGLNFEYATDAANLNLIAGDVNGDSTAVGTLSLGALTADAAATATGNVTITAEEANVTAASVVIGAKQTLALNGDEDYDLGAITAAAVDASAATGNVKLTSAGNVKTVVTGAGKDDLTANDDSIHNISSGAGDDKVTVTDAAATSQFSAGSGNDTIVLTEVATAYVAVGDEGDDLFQAADDFNAVVVGGAGTDTLEFTGAADFVAGNRTSFAMSSFEKIDVNAVALKLDSAMFANNNAFELDGTGSLTVVGKSATQGNTIDASGVTLATGATASITLEGNAKADTITGSANKDTINGTAGDDAIDGGAGADTFVATKTAEAGNGVASVVNLGSTAISAVDVLNETGLRTAGDSAVAGNTAATVFNDTLATNNASVATLSNIENVTGTGGKDYIVGSSEANVLNGGAEADYIDGGDGDDTIGGGDGNDIIIGGLGVDELTGGDGNDTITGGEGADTITGGEGADTITGGAGNDTISLAETSVAVDKVVIDQTAADNKSTVTGFKSTSDIIQISGALKTALASDTGKVAGDSTTPAAYAIETAAIGTVTDANNGTLTSADLTDLAKVAASINGAFSFTDAAGEVAQTEVFAVESDTAGNFGIYAWTQSADADTTVDSGELVLLGTVTGDDFAAVDIAIA
ncbi:hypothetical protein [Halomonas sp. 707B3]|uniref:hypothetical protein n=1 Tax=Halomonas sp. 707B3 TaxID=1681043 RepID=UPI00209D9D3D|nr:hypothetical protein [Halomonas sp. 707B3]MCP1317646.1 hypothetical protein [Halomonas sp. 707B3]